MPPTDMAQTGHSADCVCRAQGRTFAVGESACLRTAAGARARPVRHGPEQHLLAGHRAILSEIMRRNKKPPPKAAAAMPDRWSADALPVKFLKNPHDDGAYEG